MRGLCVFDIYIDTRLGFDITGLGSYVVRRLLISLLLVPYICVGIVLFGIYLVMGVNIAKACEVLYPKVNGRLSLTPWEYVKAFFLMPFILFSTDWSTYRRLKQSDLIPSDVWFVSRKQYYKGVMLFWFPVMCVKFCFGTFLLCTTGLRYALVRLVILPINQYMERIIQSSEYSGHTKSVKRLDSPSTAILKASTKTTAQQIVEVEARLLVDSKLAVELHKRLAIEQGSVDGYRGKPVSALADRDTEAECEAIAAKEAADDLIRNSPKRSWH